MLDVDVGDDDDGLFDTDIFLFVYVNVDILEDPKMFRTTSCHQPLQW